MVLKQPEIHGLVTIGLGTAILKTMFPDVPQEDLAGIYQWLNGQLISSYQKHGKPVIVIDPSADVEPESAKIMEAARVPVYTTPERAADVMGVLYRRKLYLDKVRGE
jgi:acyl-CoA synthetase (NDP forming)